VIVFEIEVGQRCAVRQHFSRLSTPPSLMLLSPRSRRASTRHCLSTLAILSAPSAPIPLFQRFR
jgi:hypothetical protein